MVTLEDYSVKFKQNQNTKSCDRWWRNWNRRAIAGRGLQSRTYHGQMCSLLHQFITCLLNGRNRKTYTSNKYHLVRVPLYNLKPALINMLI